MGCISAKVVAAGMADGESGEFCYLEMHSFVLQSLPVILCPSSQPPHSSQFLSGCSINTSSQIEVILEG